jgi:hypothetical protein
MFRRCGGWMIPGTSLVLGSCVWIRRSVFCGVFRVGDICAGGIRTLSIMDKYYTMKTNLQAQQLVPLLLWGLIKSRK